MCGFLLAGAGCGDDGGGEGTDTEGSSGSSGSGTDTTTAPETMTADDGSTTDPGTTTTDPGTTTTDPGTTSDTSGDSGSSTGAPGDCGGAADPMACEMIEGCVWVGNPQNGECIVDEPVMCDMLGMQECQQDPACDWNNQDGTCSPA